MLIAVIKNSSVNSRRVGKGGTMFYCKIGCEKLVPAPLFKSMSSEFNIYML